MCRAPSSVRPPSRRALSAATAARRAVCSRPTITSVDLMIATASSPRRQLQLGQGVAGDDRGEPLVADAQPDLGQQAVDAAPRRRCRAAGCVRSSATSTPCGCGRAGRARPVRPRLPAGRAGDRLRPAAPGGGRRRCAPCAPCPCRSTASAPSSSTPEPIGGLAHREHRRAHRASLQAGCTVRHQAAATRSVRANRVSQPTIAVQIILFCMSACTSSVHRCMRRGAARRRRRRLQPPRRRALVVSVAASLGRRDERAGARYERTTGQAGAAERRRLELHRPPDRRGRPRRRVRQRRRGPDGRRRARRPAGARHARRCCSPTSWSWSVAPGAHADAVDRRGARSGADVRRVALGNPESVPAGVYARQWLERAGALGRGGAQGGADAHGARRAGRGARGPRRRGRRLRHRRAHRAGRRRWPTRVPAAERRRSAIRRRSCAGAREARRARFLRFLQAPDARAVFEAAGFGVLVGGR